LLHAERRSTRCAPVLKTLLFFAITGSKIKLVVLSLTVKTIITAHQICPMTALEPSLATVAVTMLLAYGLWRFARSPLRRWRSRRGDQ
jgi:hypothetical protein